MGKKKKVVEATANTERGEVECHLGDVMLILEPSFDRIVAAERALGEGRSLLDVAQSIIGHKCPPMIEVASLLHAFARDPRPKGSLHGIGRLLARHGIGPALEPILLITKRVTEGETKDEEEEEEDDDVDGTGDGDETKPGNDEGAPPNAE